MEYGERKKKVQPLSFSYDQQTKTLEEIFSFEETNKGKKKRNKIWKQFTLFPSFIFPFDRDNNWLPKRQS